MLQLRKLSQTSVDSFTVFDDSQMNSSIGSKQEVEKHSIEIQTDLQFSDSQSSTSLTVPPKYDKNIPREADAVASEKEFWMTASTIKAADLDKIKQENDSTQAKCWENEKLNESLQEEYSQLYEKIKARLGED